MHDEEYGYCQCGCGQKTRIAPKTVRRDGDVKGEPRRYIKGHHHRLQGPGYVIEDLGYTTPCWIWKHGKNKGGYGRVSGSKYAHQIAYEKAYGPVPAGLVVDRLCHNADKSCPGGPCKHRRCVNPDHLEAVPPGQNSERGRGPKLTREQVREIRARPRYYGSNLAIAREFNIHPYWVSVILTHPERVWTD